MSKPTLNVGSTGPSVKEAQAKLNAHGPSKFPKLVPDGQFGFLSDRRVKEFKGQHQLDAKSSTIDEPVWEALDRSPSSKPVVPPAPPSVPPANLGGVRNKVVQFAGTQKDSVDYSRHNSAGPHGWDHLGTILKEGGDLEVSSTELKKTWQPHGIKWCSIFAVYCYRRAGADIRWGRFSGGRLFGNIRLHHRHEFPSAAAFAASIRHADICILHGAESHHVICTGLNEDLTAMRTMEGNLEFGRIKDKVREMQKVIGYYSLLT